MSIRVVGTPASIYRGAQRHRGKTTHMTKIMIDEGYRPSDDEPFMNERQREYFRRKLVRWKHDILREGQEHLAALKSENENPPDLREKTSPEMDRAIEHRVRNRKRKF